MEIAKTREREFETDDKKKKKENLKRIVFVIISKCWYFLLTKNSNENDFFFPLKDAMKMILGYKDECWGGRVHELRRAVVSDSSRGSTGSSC